MVSDQSLGEMEIVGYYYFRTEQIAIALRGENLLRNGAPIIACQDTKVIRQVLHQAPDPLHCVFAHVDVQIAELEDGESIERLWKIGPCNVPASGTRAQV